VEKGPAKQRCQGSKDQDAQRVIQEPPDPAAELGEDVVGCHRAEPAADSVRQGPADADDFAHGGTERKRIPQKHEGQHPLASPHRHHCLWYNYVILV
jgi:hypothetical protein